MTGQRDKKCSPLFQLPGDKSSRRAEGIVKTSLVMAGGALTVMISLFFDSDFIATGSDKKAILFGAMNDFLVVLLVSFFWLIFQYLVKRHLYLVNKLYESGHTKSAVSIRGLLFFTDIIFVAIVGLYATKGFLSLREFFRVLV